MTRGGGTVYQRKSDGLWIAAVDKPRHPGAPRQRRVFSAPDEETARLRLAAWLSENPRRTFSTEGRAAHMEAARALGTHTAREWWALVRKVGGACFYCGVKALAFQMDLGHVA